MEQKLGTLTKHSMLAELKKKFASTQNFVLTNYSGLSASDIDQLRKLLRKHSSEYFVVKNTLAKRVFDEMNLFLLNYNLQSY